eukprot:3902012-Rhodomonas_salina.1
MRPASRGRCPGVARCAGLRSRFRTVELGRSSFRCSNSQIPELLAGTGTSVKRNGKRYEYLHCELKDPELLSPELLPNSTRFFFFTTQQDLTAVGELRTVHSSNVHKNSVVPGTGTWLNLYPGKGSLPKDRHASAYEGVPEDVYPPIPNVRTFLSKEYHPGTLCVIIRGPAPKPGCCPLTLATRNGPRLQERAALATQASSTAWRSSSVAVPVRGQDDAQLSLPSAEQKKSDSGCI